MATFKTLDDFDLSGKSVIVRADLNVPVKDGHVSDATRIKRTLPTLRDITKVGGKAIILSHFGRPKGQVNPDYSLKLTVDAVKSAFSGPVLFAETDWNDVSGAQKVINDAPEGSVIIVENTRFHPGEEKNDTELAERMATLGELYVNDAFSSAHRAHASTAALAHLLPAAAGRAMATELEALEKGLGKPERPVIALVGGAKVSTKIDLLEHLVTKVQALVIGGGMANTFLHALGHGVGRSLCEKDLAETALRIVDAAEKARCAILLPVDVTVAEAFEANSPHHLYGAEAVDPKGMILDVGPQSIERIKGAIDDARTMVWNGPLGAFELAPFDRGTVDVAQYAAQRTKAGKLTTVAGGGDTVAALAAAGVDDKFTYVSTAGGAFLEWMEGKTLPGVAALSS